MTYTIEKNVPIPARYGSAGRPRSAISGFLATLEVTDSAYFETATNAQYRAVTNAARAVIGKGKYAARKCDGGVRVWRLA